MIGLVVGSLLCAACSDSPLKPSDLQVTAISPNSGSATGDTSVIVSGTAFASDATLTIGGVPATAVMVQSTTTIVAVVGPRPVAGPVDVAVTSSGETAVLPRAFQFVAPAGTNLPPVITAVRTTVPRPNQPAGFANIDDEVTLIPTVSNAETTGIALTYEWSGPGTFTPTTDGVTSWHLPAVMSPAPARVAATLVVSESFVEGAVMHRQASAPFAVALELHDSRQEVLDMGEDFLTLFTRQLSNDVVLHNFSPTCDGGQGRAQEAEDGVQNRARYIEDFGAFRISRRQPFTITFGGFCVPGSKPLQRNTDACASFVIHWEGYDMLEKAPFVTDGIDYVSAVLENNRWRLCHSNFEGDVTSRGVTRAVSW